MGGVVGDAVGMGGEEVVEGAVNSVPLETNGWRSAIGGVFTLLRRSVSRALLSNSGQQQSMAGRVSVR